MTTMPIKISTRAVLVGMLAAFALVTLVVLVTLYDKPPVGVARVPAAAPVVPSNPATPSEPQGAPSAPAGAVQPTQAPTQPPADDSVTTQTPAPPAVSAGGAGPIIEVATRFTAAWAAHEGKTPDQWRQDMSPYATPGLMQEFANVDPSTVPAFALKGQPEISGGDNATWAFVDVPADAGTLQLRVLATGGKWLVDGVDLQ